MKKVTDLLSRKTENKINNSKLASILIYVLSLAETFIIWLRVETFLIWLRQRAVRLHLKGVLEKRREKYCKPMDAYFSPSKYNEYRRQSNWLREDLDPPTVYERDNGDRVLCHCVQEVGTPPTAQWPDMVYMGRVVLYIGNTESVKGPAYGKGMNSERRVIKAA